MIFEYQKFLSFSISKDVWCFWIYIYITCIFEWHRELHGIGKQSTCSMCSLLRLVTSSCV